MVLGFAKLLSMASDGAGVNGVRHLQTNNSEQHFVSLLRCWCIHRLLPMWHQHNWPLSAQDALLLHHLLKRQCVTKKEDTVILIFLPDQNNVAVHQLQGKPSPFSRGYSTACDSLQWLYSQKVVFC